MVIVVFPDTWRRRMVIGLSVPSSIIYIAPRFTRSHRIINSQGKAHMVV